MEWITFQLGVERFFSYLTINDKKETSHAIKFYLNFRIRTSFLFFIFYFHLNFLSFLQSNSNQLLNYSLTFSIKNCKCDPFDLLHNAAYNLIFQQLYFFFEYQQTFTFYYFLWKIFHKPHIITVVLPWLKVKPKESRIVKCFCEAGGMHIVVITHRSKYHNFFLSSPFSFDRIVCPQVLCIYNFFSR